MAERDRIGLIQHVMREAQQRAGIAVIGWLGRHRPPGYGSRSSLHAGLIGHHGHGRPIRSATDCHEVLEQGDVVARHAVDREPVVEGLPARAPIDLVEPLDRRDGAIQVVDDEAADPVG